MGLQEQIIEKLDSREWLMAEIVRRVGANQCQVQLEVGRMVKAGVVAKSNIYSAGRRQSGYRLATGQTA